MTIEIINNLMSINLIIKLDVISFFAREVERTFIVQNIIND